MGSAARTTKPTLADIAERPARIAELSPADAAILIAEIAKLSALQVPLMVQALSVLRPADDRIVPVKEAATMLGKRPNWIYRKADLDFRVIKNGKLIGCSYQRLQRYIAETE
jgi:hypothetical protein